jgi:hypothetical protein
LGICEKDVMAPILIGGSLSFFSFLFHLLLFLFSLPSSFLLAKYLFSPYQIRFKLSKSSLQPNLYRVNTEFVPNYLCIVSGCNNVWISFVSFSPASRVCIYIMCTLPCPPTPPFKNMFYNILINQAVTKLFQKTCEKMVDIFGLNCNIHYFCTRFPRDGKPCNWHSDRNGYRTPASFSSFVLIPTKDNAAEKKFEKKTSETFGSYLVKSLPLHPLLRKSNLRIDILTEPVLRIFSSSFISLSQRETTRKRKKKKNFRKYLEDILKSSYLCIRFLKRKAVLEKKRSLNNLHKQYK